MFDRLSHFRIQEPSYDVAVLLGYLMYKLFELHIDLSTYASNIPVVSMF